jgi:ABC-type multidrug transport system fused ATPase/permease subunit
VHHEEQVVDQEYSVSVLNRFTFSWAAGLLDDAAQKSSLSLDDIPKLPASKRAGFLREVFEKARRGRKVWKGIVFAHAGALTVQMLLTLTTCFLSFGPQVALFQILKTLELRGTPFWNAGASYLWVLALGALMFVSSTVEAWLFWVIYSRIGVPIYAELSAVIFAKAMRRKDAKHTKKSTGKDGSDTGKKAEQEAEEDAEEALKKSRQSIINLAAVDARRISDFASFNYVIPLAIVKIIIGCGFLVQILGWRSAFAGLAVSALVTPLNIYAAKKYSNAQDRLMKFRDQKLAIVTEVLQGIRQIKFSALEEQWQTRVQETRETELGALWAAFLADIGLISIWILGPVGLSAVSLATYAMIHGGLTASVAFTAMSVFSSLEMALAILPELTSIGLEAKVSADRIDKFLATSEKIVNTVPAEYIAFENASVAWPAEEDAQDDEDRFVLRDLNLKFPTKSLSVVSGRTGSGKSLLLSCILGECDVLGGTVKAPVPPPIKERYDHLATKANWIIDSAIAYVAQIPWIENATIKENVLFGLPDDAERYKKVIFACALEKDFEMLPDGDLTDIGANGVNLSGGQRWRISFARALYSRAGILVMDDIFSALDAHTGRFVYENALTGELGQGRTRVLVTHHVALCLPRTDYSVLLENGRIKYAGTIDDLKESHHLEDILREERAAHEADHAVIDDESRDFLNDEETTLQKVISNTSHRRSSTAANGHTNGHNNDHASNGNGNAPESAPVPKKFVEDEKRETGSVRLAIYGAFLGMGGSVVYWIITVFIFLLFAALMVGRVSEHPYRITKGLPFCSPMNYTNNLSGVVDQYLDKIVFIQHSSTSRAVPRPATAHYAANTASTGGQSFHVSRSLRRTLHHCMHCRVGEILFRSLGLSASLKKPLQRPHTRRSPCTTPLARHCPTRTNPQSFHSRLPLTRFPNWLRHRFLCRQDTGGSGDHDSWNARVPGGDCIRHNSIDDMPEVIFDLPSRRTPDQKTRKHSQKSCLRAVRLESRGSHHNSLFQQTRHLYRAHVQQD